jgi:hypothetical protein
MRDVTPLQRGGVFRKLTCLLGILLVTPGCSSSNGSADTASAGLDYHLETLQDPRPNRVHVICVDLANPELQLAVTIGPDPDGNGPAETTLTDPRTLADDPAVLAYINTNPWSNIPDESGRLNRGYYEGQPVDIHGLAVAQGVTRSSSKDHTACVGVTKSGRVFIGSSPEIESAVEVMTGFQPVVTNGVIAVAGSEVRHPRTAIGLDRKGTRMWWVVVDGRQAGYSEGMSLYELGEVMLGLGCWSAVNMDGGGSSLMGLAGPDRTLRVVNSPSGRHLGTPRIRPLPAILTIRAVPHP